MPTSAPFGSARKTRSTNCCPHKMATTVPNARNGPNGTTVRRLALSSATVTTPKTAPATKPNNSAGNTMPGFSQPRYMPSRGARRTSPSPNAPLPIQWISSIVTSAMAAPRIIIQMRSGSSITIAVMARAMPPSTMPVKVIVRGRRWVCRSIQVCATSTAPRMQYAGSGAVSSNLSANSTNMPAVDSSMTIGSMPIAAPQRRHFPRRTTQLTTGIRSSGPRRSPHERQRLGGVNTDSPRGTRSTTTVRNEPTTRPATTMTKISTGRLISTNGRPWPEGRVANHPGTGPDAGPRHASSGRLEATLNFGQFTDLCSRTTWQGRRTVAPREMFSRSVS